MAVVRRLLTPTVGYELPFVTLFPASSGDRKLAQRLSELRPGLPVIFMLGYADADLSSRGLLESGIPHLEKPFSPDALTRMMRAVLLRPA